MASKQLSGKRKNWLKVSPAPANDGQLEAPGYPSGQGGDQLDKGQELRSGHMITPKKHWLKVLPPIEEFNNRLETGRPVQKQASQASLKSSTAKILQLVRQAKKAQKSSGRASSPMKSPQIQSAQEVSSQGPLKSSSVPLTKPSQSPPLAQATKAIATSMSQSRPAQHPTLQPQSVHKSLIPRDLTDPRASPPLVEQAGPKKSGARSLPAIEDYTTELATSRAGQSEDVDVAVEPIRASIDSFVGSDRVINLGNTTFNQFVSSKDITLVMFYDKTCPLSSWSKSHFKQAAEMTNRVNHQYAAVDCTKGSENELCNTEGILSVPFFKVYSKGRTVARIKEPRTFQAEIMKRVVEMTPVKNNAPPQSSSVD